MRWRHADEWTGWPADVHRAATTCGSRDPGSLRIHHLSPSNGPSGSRISTVSTESSTGQLSVVVRSHPQRQHDDEDDDEQRRMEDNPHETRNDPAGLIHLAARDPAVSLRPQFGACLT